MKLEQQVCSRELAEKLKKLGVKQESLFRWVELIAESIGKSSWNIRQSHNPEPNKNSLSAFTVAELGEMLTYFHTEKTDKHGFYEYVVELTDAYERFVDVSEADARAKMLIYLIENSLIEI
jgi:hypothetical protein